MPEHLIRSEQQRFCNLQTATATCPAQPSCKGPENVLNDLCVKSAACFAATNPVPLGGFPKGHMAPTLAIRRCHD
jgi:hypothetical protein